MSRELEIGLADLGIEPCTLPKVEPECRCTRCGGTLDWGHECPGSPFEQLLLALIHGAAIRTPEEEPDEI